MTSPSTRNLASSTVRSIDLVLAEDLERDLRAGGHRVDRQDQAVGVGDGDVADGEDLVVDQDVPSSAGVPGWALATRLVPCSVEADAEEAVLVLLALLQRLDDPPALDVHRDRVAGLRVEPGGVGERRSSGRPAPPSG